MPRDVVVIGASAGGLKALRQVVAHLPVALPAAVLVVTHLSPTGPNRLAEILNKVGSLPAAPAVDGEPLRPGHIHCALTDRHLLVGEDDVVRLSRGPRENLVRPAIDALFRSAARWCGPRVVGVVLSGSLDDGAAGLAAVAAQGGAALVQRPGEALFDSMPRAALAAVPGATVRSAVELGEVIAALVGRPVRERPSGGANVSDQLIWETDMTIDGSSGAGQPGEPVGLGCPECNGGMNVVRTGNAVHYLCHTGHSYSPQSFVAASDEGIEAALWTALSAMQEKMTVLREMAARAEAAGDPEQYRRHSSAADEVGEAANRLRRYMVPAGRGSHRQAS